MLRGPLTTCLLSDLIPKNAILEGSSCLCSLVFVVPIAKLGEWRENYETLTPFVVPTSAREVTTDDKNFQLVTVVVFSKFASEFVEAAQSKGFIYRPASAQSESRVQLLQRERDVVVSMDTAISKVGFEFDSYLRKAVETNYLALYAETILRYGLPSTVETFYLITTSAKEHSAVREFLKSACFPTEPDRKNECMNEPLVFEFFTG